MNLPSITDSGVAVILYTFLLVITGFGLYQFAKSRYLLKEGESMKFRSMVPLGWASLAFGFIGLFNQYKMAFQLIEAAGDISPAIVASAMRTAFNYPILGFLCLAVSYVFRFVNQHEMKVTKE